jgi:hypothetical protein
MATYLNAPSGRFGTPTNAKKYTISTWIKPAVEGNDTNNFFNYNYGSGKQAISIQIRNNDQTLRINQYVPGTDTYDIRTNRVFRDPSAWYHIVIKYDSTQSTASDRVKLYVNGENQTSLAASNYPAQDADSFIADTPNNNKGINIGNQWDGSGNASANSYFLGYMAQFIYTDGYAYDASTFGSTNANGIWVPNSSPSVTYGTNGFKLDFAGTGASADASGFGADSSGNGNHFTANSLGTNPSTTDTCQNNFMTLNPLAILEGGNSPNNIPDYSKGNTVATASNGTTRFAMGTFATTMPYYFEVKVLSTSSTDSSQRVGVIDEGAFHKTATYSSVYKADGVITATGESDDSGNQSLTANSVVGVAVDLATNNNIKYYHNGTLQATMAVGTSYRSLATTPFARLVDATQSFSFNFGNPSYTISSGNADANGYGNFEYAVPSGYYALCTKNLAAYGG